MRWVAAYDWRLDLLSHFTLAALGVTLLALVMVRRRRRLALLLGALALYQAGPIVRLYGPNPVPPAPGSTDRIKLLIANVFVDNEDYATLQRLVRAEDPDVVGLIEFTVEWQQALRPLAEQYPYRVEFPNGPLGLALWSKRPASISQPMTLHPQGWPVLRATLDLAGAPLRVWLAHPTSPARRLGEQDGFAELLALGDRVGQEPGPRVIVGDLNTTDGSPFFAELLRRSGTRDGRIGFGMQLSWPVGWPYQITIDHVLPSPELAVTERRLGPPIGSDHRPVLVELAPARDAARKPSSQADQSR